MNASTQAQRRASEPPRWLPRAEFQRLLDALARHGYRVLGPVRRDGSVVHDTVTRVEDLPVGWRDVQEPGRYRLEEAGDGRLFGVVHGPGGIKRHVFAPREPLLQIETPGPGRAFRARPTLPEPERMALLGVRACDLAGLAAQARELGLGTVVLTGGCLQNRLLGSLLEERLRAAGCQPLRHRLVPPHDGGLAAGQAAVAAARLLAP